MKNRFSDEQIIKFLREADRGAAVKELCRKHGFSDAKRLKALETENLAYIDRYQSGFL